MTQLSHEEYQKRRDEIVFNFIKDVIPPEYHAHLIDSDDNAGERLRQAIDDLVLEREQALLSEIAELKKQIPRRFDSRRGGQI